MGTKVNLSIAERDEQFGVVVNMLRAYRRNASEYHAHHEKLRSDEGCVCKRCVEYERLERLYPQFIKE